MEEIDALKLKIYALGQQQAQAMQQRQQIDAFIAQCQQDATKIQGQIEYLEAQEKAKEAEAKPAPPTGVLEGDALVDAVAAMHAESELHKRTTQTGDFVNL